MHVRTKVAALLGAGLLLGGTSISMGQTVVGPAAPGAVHDPYSGLYAGVELGGALGSSRKNFSQGTTTGEFDVSGVVGGAEAGYGWTLNDLVVGIEGDISGTDVSGTTHSPNPTFTYETDNHWLGTVRPRLGYLVGPSALPYVTGGLAVGDLHVRAFRTATGALGTDFSRIEPGWVVGAGFETGLFSPNWRLKAEYLYVKLSDAKGPSETGPPTQTQFHEHILRLGLNYAF